MTLEPFWLRVVRPHFLLLAEGATMNLNGPGGNTKPDSKPPPNAGEDLRKLDGRWANAKSHRAQRAVCIDALELLRNHLVPNPDIRKQRGTLAWKEAIANEPRPSRVVARMYGVSFRTVCEYRIKHQKGSKRDRLD